MIYPIALEPVQRIVALLDVGRSSKAAPVGAGLPSATQVL
jgi:hypothetical protein